MRSLSFAFSWLLSAGLVLGCSGESSDGGGEEQGGGTSGTGQGGSTSGGSSSGGTTSGGSAGGGSPNGGTSTGGSSTGGSGGSTSGGSTSGGSGGSGGGGVTKSGLCGQNMLATATDDSFEGTLDYFTVSEEVLDDGRYDEYICQIRFEVTRVGESPNAAGCVDLDGAACEWSHLVELGNPTVIIDEDGVCARNQLMQDQAWIDAQVGTRAAYGFIDMYEGHDSVVMKYNESRMMWETHERATWDMDGSNEFTFNNRAGCTYVE